MAAWRDHPVLVAILSALWFFTISRFLVVGAWGETASPVE
jgi:uncharacterized membrane protein